MDEGEEDQRVAGGSDGDAGHPSPQLWVGGFVDATNLLKWLK